MAQASIFDMTDKRTADKQKALESALSQIERQFGKGSIMKLGKDNPVGEIESTSTGSLGLDIALGIGGLPKGRIIEILRARKLGQDHADAACGGRGTEEGRRLRLCRCRTRAGPAIRQEAGREPGRAADRQPDTGEQALEIVDTLVRSGAVSMVVIDSVAALTPKSEIEGDMGDMQLGCRPA